MATGITNLKITSLNLICAVVGFNNSGNNICFNFLDIVAVDLTYQGIT